MCNGHQGVFAPGSGGYNVSPRATLFPEHAIPSVSYVALPLQLMSGMVATSSSCSGWMLAAQI